MSHYDTILYYDSHFQKVIIDYLLKTEYKDSNNLVIDAIGGQITMNDKEYPIAFNTIKQSLSSIGKSNSFPKGLSCDKIVGSVLTGSNSAFFLSSISYKKIILTDDGIGTPVILKCGDIFKLVDLKFKLNFLLLRLILLLTGKKAPLRNKKIIKEIHQYFTIYNDETTLNSTKIIPFNNQFTIQEGVKAFIGQPFIEYKMMTKKDYIDTLLKVKGEGILKYFPDPSEKWHINETIEGIEFQKKGTPLELRFQQEGMPEQIYTFVSSAILNLKTVFPPMEGYFIRIPKAKKFRDYYYNVLLDNGIQEFK
jgi:hypothetical protein